MSATVTRRTPVAVVGGGVGGLATAIRLRARGHPVTLLERGPVAGGKLATHEEAGHTFDLGPSLVTLPHLLAELFHAAGRRLEDHLALVRLDPQFSYRWPDGARLTVRDAPDDTAGEFARFTPGGAEQWRRFDHRGRTIWDVSVRTFFAGPMSNPIDLARRARSPRDFVAIDAGRTLAEAATATFHDPRLVQWAGRYATYSGSSPFRVPATLACIPHIESRYGCWYPMGGLGRLRDALAELATDTGVEVMTDTEVVAVDGDTRRVDGVVLADGQRLDAPIVVVNADADHLYSDLLPDAGALRRVRRAERSTSGFVLCLGVAGRTPGIGHHNVWFAADPRAEFDEMAHGELAADPTVYACVSSVTDPSQAPAGEENWFLLVNTPPGAVVDHDRYGDLVLDRLAAHGTDLRGRIRTRFTMGPADIERRDRTVGGAIYGTSSNGRRAAFVRPGNRGVRRGLYLVGGSSHPGGGLPLVVTGARIVADLVATDFPS